MCSWRCTLQPCSPVIQMGSRLQRSRAPSRRTEGISHGTWGMGLVWGWVSPDGVTTSPRRWGKASLAQVFDIEQTPASRKRKAEGLDPDQFLTSRQGLGCGAEQPLPQSLQGFRGAVASPGTLTLCCLREAVPLTEFLLGFPPKLCSDAVRAKVENTRTSPSFHMAWSAEQEGFATSLLSSPAIPRLCALNSCWAQISASASPSASSPAAAAERTAAAAEISLCDKEKLLPLQQIKTAPDVDFSSAGLGVTQHQHRPSGRLYPWPTKMSFSQ